MNKNIFQVSANNNVKESTFDLTHDVKLSMQIGRLYPVLIQEVLPGDKFNIDTQSLIRFSPLIAPVMHRLNSFIHFFYVPNRVIDPNWESIMSGSDAVTATQEIDFEVVKGSLLDYMGIPPADYSTGHFNINTHPIRAYIQIYNDYYRDTALEPTELSLSTEFTTEKPLKRAWEKDYFTSALPYAQSSEFASTVQVDLQYQQAVATSLDGATDEGEHLVLGDLTGEYRNIETADGQKLTIANVYNAEIEIENLRKASRLQEWLERTARGGKRYVEQILSHFGVESRDSRLQNAEFIGGGKTPITISEVLNHTGTTELPQGNMSGHGLSVGLENKAFKNVEEHGFIIGIMSVMPEPAYFQGLHKMFRRLTNFDYYYPEFANLGEQPIKVSELYHTANVSDNNETFGYQSAFAEYKYNCSRIAGDFRDNLDHWHLARKFENKPVLNSEFIRLDPEQTKRIFAVTDAETDDLYVQCLHRIMARRKMPYYSIPKL